MPDPVQIDKGRTPVWYVHDHDYAVLSTAIRERRQARRLAYTFDPGLALAERSANPDD